MAPEPCFICTGCLRVDLEHRLPCCTLRHAVRAAVQISDVPLWPICCMLPDMVSIIQRQVPDGTNAVCSLVRCRNNGAGHLPGWRRAAIKGRMGAELTSLIVGSQPVFTAAWMSSRGNQMTSVQWFGIGLGSAGLLLVVSQKLHVGEVRLPTVIFAVTALTSMTIGTLYQKRFIKQCDVRTASIIQMAAAVYRDTSSLPPGDRRILVVSTRPPKI